MLIITHKLRNNVGFKQDFAAVPLEAWARFNVSLPVDQQLIDNGASLSTALKPVIHAEGGRRLKWWEISTKTTTQLDSDLYNTDFKPVVPFGSGLVPFANVVL